MPTCPSCGQPGQYDGWHYGMYEAMSVYQNMYGLKPIGPHRRLADELFANTSVACLTCAGKGLLDVSAGDAWIPCPDCRGMGYVWKSTSGEVKALRRQVLEAFPDAACRCRQMFSRGPRSEPGNLDDRKPKARGFGRRGK